MRVRKLIVLPTDVKVVFSDHTKNKNTILQPQLFPSNDKFHTLVDILSLGFYVLYPYINLAHNLDHCLTSYDAVQAVYY